jgi:exodeoxyribonuclease-3
VGGDLDPDAGKAAARQVGLTILATLLANLGSLDRVGRVVKVLGMVSCPADFEKHPHVINGCSELFAEIWGADRGVGVRSAFGVASLPNGQAMRVASVYVPNGQEIGSDKFAYKMRFLDRLRDHAAALLGYEEILVIGGDYNIAPDPQDVYNPAKLAGTLCFHPAEREKFRALLHLGLYDAWRLQHPTAQQFSWWDYRAQQFERNEGYRIDHLLLSPQAADRLAECGIDETPRRAEKPSDHTPVWCEINTG